MAKVVFTIMILIQLGLVYNANSDQGGNQDCPCTTTTRTSHSSSSEERDCPCTTTTRTSHSSSSEERDCPCTTTPRTSHGSSSKKRDCTCSTPSIFTSTTPEASNCSNPAENVTDPVNHNLLPKPCVKFTQKFMRAVDANLISQDMNTVMRATKNLELTLEQTVFSHSVSMKEGHLTAHLHKADKSFGNFSIYANDDQVDTNLSQVLNSTVEVTLPEELVSDIQNRTVVFCMINSPTFYENVSNGLLIGVSVGGKNVSGLKSPVVISVRVSLPANKQPKCAFYNYTSSNFEYGGCSTSLSTQRDKVICSCDHLTYFAVLLVSPENISTTDQVILTYISKVGCSLSLLFLVVTVVLYIVKWRTSADHSQQVHISLAVALILLNGHFLAVDLVGKVPIACIYVAVILHYSLMATFTWTAIEGFHLYLLLLRVFNIYIRRYLLKLSLVGWGVPAIVVILIFIINKNVYLKVASSSGSSNNNLCYISNDIVKYVTIFGFFCVVFAFNLVMLVVVVRTLVFQRHVIPGQIRKHRAKHVFTILGITCLLGITWGLIFLSFGRISTVGLYFFCIFNTLQGLFIFIWFFVSKSAPSGREERTNTQTTTT